jgi:hypothetical protein
MIDDELPVDDLAPEDICPIDIDAIDEEAAADARDMIKIVTDLYQDDHFKDRHPQAQRRINMELETLRGLIKMRKADEEAHDALLRAISENKSNASLYRSMAEIQKTSIAITNKIHDTIDRLNATCKAFQLELEFKDEPETTGEQSSTSSVHRGSKSFIQDMLNEPTEQDLFETSEDQSDDTK